MPDVVLFSKTFIAKYTSWHVIPGQGVPLAVLMLVVIRCTTRTSLGLQLL